MTSTTLGVIEQARLDIKNNLFIKVADIEVGNINSAYDLSNNIDTPWIKNDKVLHVYLPDAIDKGGTRSTSVGDLILFFGRIWQVDICGFADIGPAELLDPISVNVSEPKVTQNEQAYARPRY